MNGELLVQSRSRGSTPIRVLMADPDASLPAAYREPLLQEGFELVTAENGLECIACLRLCVPDVLVLEPRMPWGGGDGVLAIMGESSDLATVPVMILTSCRDPHVLKSVERFPVSDYQVKPLASDRLAGRLRGLLGHPRLRFTLDDHNGRLECAISRRTGGRVRDLRVEVRDGRVIVRGCTESHHVKQLVLAAVLEAIEASQSQSERVARDSEASQSQSERVARDSEASQSQSERVAWDMEASQSQSERVALDIHTLRPQSESVALDIEVCGDCQSTIPAMCFNSKGKSEALRWSRSGEADR